MRDWRRSRTAAGVVIAAFLAIQLAVPISRLSTGDTDRFGWKMYSTTAIPPTFVVETATGSVEVDFDEYLASRRIEIDFEAVIPPHLCQVVDGAISVTWENGELEC